MLIKNTIGRVGRLGEYSIGNIYYLEKGIKELLDNIELKLSISEEKEKNKVDKEIQNKKISEICDNNNFNKQFVEEILDKNNWNSEIFLKFLNTMKEIEIKFDNFTSIINIALKINKNYNIYSWKHESSYLRGWLQWFYKRDDKKIH